MARKYELSVRVITFVTCIQHRRAKIPEIGSTATFHTPVRIDTWALSGWTDNIHEEFLSANFIHISDQNSIKKLKLELDLLNAPVINYGAVSIFL